MVYSTSRRAFNAGRCPCCQDTNGTLTEAPPTAIGERVWMCAACVALGHDDAEIVAHILRELIA